MLRFIVAVTALILAIFCKGQDLEYARRIIEILSSPEFKGRGYVQNGHRKAARFIAREFSETGLKGFHTSEGFEKKFYQVFPITVNTFPAKMELAIDGVSLKAGSEFLVDPSSTSCKGNFGLYVISGNELNEPDLLSRVIREVQGKFVMIDARVGDNDVLRKAGELVEIISFSERIPSSGTLIITNEKLTWSISKHRAAKPVLTVNSGRIGNNPSEVYVNVRSALSDHITRNVAGYLPGAGCPDSFIMIIAHYDHLGKMGKEVYFPGANDNASGISMLLSVAKYFRKNPHRYSIVFVAMAAEESGLDGSGFFADHSPFDLKKTIFLVNFDLAGTGDEGIKVVNGTVYKDKFALLDSLNSRSGYLKDVQVRGPACNSDHCVFYQRGVPCFFIYTLGGVSFYHDIHDRSDALPLSEFTDYLNLMIDFLSNIKHTK